MSTVIQLTYCVTSYNTFELSHAFDSLCIFCQNFVGNLFHIDFGHVLGNFKTKMGVQRERSAFVFTHQMLEVMGGTLSDERFLKFEKLCCNGLNKLRERGHLFTTLFRLMIPAGMPEVQKAEDILYLSKMLQLDATELEAEDTFKKELQISLEAKSRLYDNYFHLVKHGMTAET